jgi:hypothetical protein
MDKVQRAFEEYVELLGLNLTKRRDGKYLMKNVRSAFAQFREVYEIGHRAARQEAALQALTEQAQELDMGY